jgi:hypothetical protein
MADDFADEAEANDESGCSVTASQAFESGSTPAPVTSPPPGGHS